MSITKNQVASRYGIQVTNVKQIKSKQMFICSITGELYLISYLTIVGKFNRVSNTWLITNLKYSPSTSKQLTLFKRENPNYVVVDGVITL